MRKTLLVSALAAAGLAFGTGADGGADDKQLLLIYSADERGELHPCG